MTWCAVLLPGLVLTACGSPPGRAPASPPAAASPGAIRQQAARRTARAHGSVFGRPLLSPQVAVTRSGIYLTWQASPPGSAVTGSELARIDVATGKIEARRRFGAALGQVLEAAGSLWIAAQTGSARADRMLLRLNPKTLQVTLRRRLGIGSAPRWGGQVLAVADGRLWIADVNRLLRLSLPGGKVTGSITLPRAASSDLSANASGTMLVVGEADSSGRGAVQRRDPATGALLVSRTVWGVAAPEVAGPISSAVWISEPTGMLGYIRQLNAATMTTTGSACTDGPATSVCVTGTNGITARLADGLLWVTQIAGGSSRNYCADPSNGRKLAPIELPQPAQDVVLAVAQHRIFYAAPGPKASQHLRQEAIPSPCRARG